MKRDYNTTGDYEPEVLEKLHALLTEMLGDFQMVCDKYGLEYFALYGTAIGAVRHKGFIPWDDDLDIGMERHDFEKFMEVAEKELGGSYRVASARTDPLYTSTVVKLQLKDTIFISGISRDMDFEQCVFIDIFPLDAVAPTRTDAARQLHKTVFFDRLMYLRGTAYPIIPYNGLKGEAAQAVCSFAHFLLKLFHVSPKFLFRCFEKEAERYNSGKCTYLAVFGLPTALRYVFKRESMYPLKEVPFETGVIHLASNNDATLRMEYGDYMQLPPEDQRVNHCPYILKFPGEPPIINDKNR